MIEDGFTGTELGGGGEAETPRRRGAQAAMPPYDLARAEWMFWISLSFLAVLAALLPHGGVETPIETLVLYHPFLPYALLGLWGVILIEGVAGALAAPDRGRAWRRLALVAFLPPFRMAVSPRRPNDWVWLPRYGWLPVANESVASMEQRTAIAMLLATALIVPVLIVDFGFAEAVEASRPLQVALAVLMASIWFSFALEFTVMVSLAPKKLNYCKKHWISIVIVVLPLFAFLRTIQLFNFLRVAKASKLAKAYRLRGLATRLLKIALAFNLVDRLMAFSPERHCASLEEKIAEKEEELADLRARLEMARQRAVEKAAERAAKAAGTKDIG